ncbi:acetyl-CoA synthetase-like protein [Aspergillus sclerotioniger CBS 115572]|uniref:Very long-chain fatty acid transport protein n=1 Tax=Aspergillus sclerotioniger CBS 115572 TaxID=1450535 RepID=A0A317W2X3_9EURO|nr:acetyl-CoA synthetase-like protein [Aspergillus sclerotioniger CBS 115572]PWY80894.1 acetyl-CoA synthetase-like protein [Aspergillus sclerotioniger CBS 115572]
MALATAGAVALAAYLDAKFHLTRDVASLRATRRALRETEKAAAQGQLSPWLAFTATAAKYPDMDCLWTRERSCTYRETLTAAARYGHFFRSRGVQKGDLVAFYLQNGVEFIFAWLGLWSIGCAPAAINYSLAGDALVHCLTISGAKLVLVDPDPECIARVEERRPTLEKELGMELVTVNDTLTNQLLALPASIPEDGRLAHNVPPSSPAILLYTSGTTGLPKGCAFTTSRMYTVLRVRGSSTNNTDGPNGDRWYGAMPLYHGTSAITLMGNLLGGTSIAIAPRFSVRGFWRDIRDSKATVFVYVGEVVRYLLAAPPSPLDRQHRVRMMYGNGLRPDVWERFRERFGVAEVGEFFNSTEGIFVLFNANRGPFTAGCVGHHGLLLRLALRNTYVPVVIDPTTEDAVRDPKTGLAKRAAYEEGGEMLVRVPDKKAFQGYWRNEQATQKKFMQDVLQKGDLWYRSGDALRRDSDGRWYFLDRLGDTFRWKSENVSTAEVAQVLGQYPGIQEANVYGVLVPNHEGRAGCAALQLSPEAQSPGGFDWKGLARFARAQLPRYAVPVFLRLVQNSAHIHNHKQNKVPLRDEGVEPAKLGTKAVEGQNDRLYWLPPGEGGYIEFGERDWQRLVGGEAKL